MNIIEIDGKDYLETYFAKLDNDHIDCTPFFIEVQECIQNILKKYNKQHKTNFTYIGKDEYGSNLQNILNRYSGDYFSPSFLKSYTTNPAGCFYSMFCEDDVSAASSIGTTFHSIMETFFKEGERTPERLAQLCEEQSLEGQFDKIKEYANGFLSTKDYLNDPNYMEPLKCLCETRGRDKLYVNSLGVTTPTCSYVIDRVDYREDGIYIVDYKTGKVSAKNATFEGNLAQMIIYKWAAESYYNEKIKGVYICDPGSSLYRECDCGLENEKLLWEHIMKFFDQLNKDNRQRIYTYTDKGYFLNDQMKEFRRIMNDPSIRMAKIPLQVLIGDHQK